MAKGNGVRNSVIKFMRCSKISHKNIDNYLKDPDLEKD